MPWLLIAIGSCALCCAHVRHADPRDEFATLFFSLSNPKPNHDVVQRVVVADVGHASDLLAAIVTTIFSSDSHVLPVAFDGIDCVAEVKPHNDFILAFSCRQALTLCATSSAALGTFTPT